MGSFGSRISRRTLLRGAGAALALPLLESMRPLRAIAGAPVGPNGAPLRMGIVSVTGGTVLESWKCAEEGPLTRLPSILRPLESHKDNLLVLTGLSNHGKSENLNGHEHCAFNHLTGAKSVKKVDGKVYASISVDQAAARVVGETTYLPSIEMGLSNHETRYSFRGPSEPVPYENNPRLVFERMFRGRKPTVPNWNRRSTITAEEIANSAKTDSYDRSVLDLVLEDAKSLRSKVSRGDRERIDEYLSTVRKLEKRIAFLEIQQQRDALEAVADGSAAAALKIPALPPASVPIWQIINPVMRDPEKHGEYLRVMADLFVLAFQTNTTRVATLAVGSDEASFPGVVTVGYERHAHTLQHQGNAHRVEDADPIAREACRQIHAWYTQLFAEIVTKMESIDEGGSSLLDNSMLLYTSYMANGGHGQTDYPVLLAGKAGGSLKTGRQVDYKRGTPMANLYVEMLNRMGVATDEFGESRTSQHAQYDGRLPNLV